MPREKREVTLRVRIETDLADEDLQDLVVMEFGLTRGPCGMARMHRHGWPEELDEDMFRGNVLSCTPEK